MMHMIARLSWTLPAMLLVSAAAAQDLPYEPPPKATEVPTEGFWPTKVMLYRMLDRAADDMADRYDFDDEQRKLTLELLRERVPQWMNENRAELQTLTNQFFEAQLNDVPPEVDMVTDWSQHVQPMLIEFSDLMDSMADDMRSYMTDDQEAQLDSELAAFHAGLTLVHNKLGVWAEGGYDPETDWTAPGPPRRDREREERHQMREVMNQARRDAVDRGDTEAAAALESAAPTESEPLPTTTSQPLDEWAKFTYAFIERYEFNREQRERALTFLREAQEDRDKYLRSKRDELDAVAQRLEQSKDDESEVVRLAALRDYDQLTAPVDRRFDQLKDRLDTLPTREQRRAAAKADIDRRRAERDAADARAAAAPASRPAEVPEP